MLIPELLRAWPVDPVYIYLPRCACACFVYIHPSIHPCNTCQPRSPKGERTIVTLYYLAHNSSSDSVSSSPPSTSYAHPICNFDPPKKPAVQVPHPAQLAQLREAQKNKYVSRLVGQYDSHYFLAWPLLTVPSVHRSSREVAM